MYDMFVFADKRWHGFTTKNRAMYYPLSSERHENKKYRDFVAFIRHRDEQTCQHCGSKNRKDLRVHHMIPYRERPDLALDPNNVLLLCGRCEEIDHERYNRQRLSYKKKVKSYV